MNSEEEATGSAVLEAFFLGNGSYLISAYTLYIEAVAVTSEFILANENAIAVNLIVNSCIGLVVVQGDSSLLEAGDSVTAIRSLALLGGIDVIIHLNEALHTQVIVVFLREILLVPIITGVQPQAVVMHLLIGNHVRYAHAVIAIVLLTGLNHVVADQQVGILVGVDSVGGGHIDDIPSQISIHIAIPLGKFADVIKFAPIVNLAGSYENAIDFYRLGESQLEGCDFAALEIGQFLGPQGYSHSALGAFGNTTLETELDFWVNVVVAVQAQEVLGASKGEVLCVAGECNGGLNERELCTHGHCRDECRQCKK